MKTIYDHNRLIARFCPVDMWVLFEKSGECGRAKRLRRATSCLPTLQGPHANRQSRFDENERRLGLAELVGFTPAPQMLNHGRQAFSASTPSCHEILDAGGVRAPRGTSRAQQW